MPVALLLPLPSKDANQSHLTNPSLITAITTYRITYRDAQYKEHTYPVISESAHQAVADLARLGYQITRVVHSFPSV